jgi:hypothetical protein
MKLTSRGVAIEHHSETFAGPLEEAMGTTVNWRFGADD